MIYIKYKHEDIPLKGIVHPKIKFLSFITHPRVISNP